jgi:UDP-N-acetylglucosamine--N-acetylmuramyl-(pentapeptide) pyrophosphoryl-undecaprenol N-acetylglucosamine transferase
MKVLAGGGGSGGHVTPVVAVLKEIRRVEPEAELRFWCDFKFAPQAKATLAKLDSTIPISRIVAGKLRRYNHLRWWQQVKVPGLLAGNVRDFFLVGAGLVQSLFKLIFWRPDVIFTKGGFVCLPVGLAAHWLRIPLVIHDSDAHPGLTNRILARWATQIATGAPLEYYPYPKSRSHYIGIPVAEELAPVSIDQQTAAKAKWGLDVDRPLIVVTGGGLGAMRINNTVLAVKDELLGLASVVLVSGTAQYDELRAKLPPNDEHFQLHSFVTEMPSLLSAADVVVARAGATTILELAALAKPTILIPNAKLTGGHQVKNANVYLEDEAVKVIVEADMEANSQLLVQAVKELLESPDAAKAMAERFHKFAKPDAAEAMAKLIISAVK